MSPISRAVLTPALLLAALVAAPLALALAAGMSGAGGRTDGAVTSADRTGENRAMPTTQTSAVHPVYSRAGYDITPLGREAVAELAKNLTPEQYRITQKAGTERPFCGTLLDNRRSGTYCCVVCGLPLYRSDAKFNSGTGWPSFHSPFDPAHIRSTRDDSHGMTRTEITCARCDAHLGHVFDDGPAPTGHRHCLNSESLVFFGAEETLPAASRPVETQVAYFAAGCFWGVEHYFQKGPGVLDAVSGYMQGHLPDPTYRAICDGGTGHAETVRVTFDPKRISYRRLLEAFFVMHDPTQLDRQGPDVGDQYRSGIWVTDESQEAEARAYMRELADAGRYARPIVTRVERAKTFYAAEAYHQDYILKTGRACHVRDPWQ